MKSVDLIHSLFFRPLQRRGIAGEMNPRKHTFPFHSHAFSTLLSTIRLLNYKPIAHRHSPPNDSPPHHGRWVVSVRQETNLNPKHLWSINKVILHSGVPSPEERVFRCRCADAVSTSTPLTITPTIKTRTVARPHKVVPGRFERRLQ